MKLIKCLREERVSLAISDLFMPEVDGIEILRLLQSEFPEIPMIGLSVAANVWQRVCLNAMRALGANTVFEKPVDQVVLLNTVGQPVSRGALAK
jgi:CheY-like chemotaxis protein